MCLAMHAMAECVTYCMQRTALCQHCDPHQCSVLASFPTRLCSVCNVTQASLVLHTSIVYMYNDLHVVNSAL